MDVPHGRATAIVLAPMLVQRGIPHRVASEIAKLVGGHHGVFDAAAVPRGTPKTGQWGTPENRPTEVGRTLNRERRVTLPRREQCLERREATTGDRAGAAGLAAAAH